jgi:two-component system, response regulator, stage 0 sporulation protein F
VQHHVPEEAAATTVLVADDDDDMRAMVVEALRMDGYRVLEARDGVELLATLSDAHSDTSAAVGPTVVVADVRMPKMSGLAVLEELRREQNMVPVLMITGLASKAVHILAKRLGAMCVFRKPFDLDDLRTAVMNAQRWQM